MYIVHLDNHAIPNIITYIKDEKVSNPNNETLRMILEQNPVARKYAQQQVLSAIGIPAEFSRNTLFLLNDADAIRLRNMTFADFTAINGENYMFNTIQAKTCKSKNAKDLYETLVNLATELQTSKSSTDHINYEQIIKEYHYIDEVQQNIQENFIDANGNFQIQLLASYLKSIRPDSKIVRFTNNVDAPLHVSMFELEELQRDMLRMYLQRKCVAQSMN